MAAETLPLGRKLPTVLVLASGRGDRFRASGGTVHKLKAMLNGKPVLQHTLDAVRASGLPWHLEDSGHPGMGDSIAAAVRATPDANGWLILPADLPMVTPATLCAVADGLKAAEVVVPLYTAAAGAEPERGHPVGFSRACRSALLALCGEGGAAKVVKSYRVHSLQLNDPGMLADVDTLDDLERLAKQLQ